MKKIAVILLALVLVVATFASCSIEIDFNKIASDIESIGEDINDKINGTGEPQVVEENGFRYQLNSDKTAYVKEYLADDEAVVIPYSVNGCKVTRIEARAFYGKNMKNVTVPETVTEIGELAFANCARMEWIDLRRGLETIGESALAGTTALKEIYFAGYAADWTAVQKGENWKLNDPPTEVVVHCTNGDLKVNG